MSFAPSSSSWDNTGPDPDKPRNKGMFEFRVENATTRRCMFITGDPVGVYRHSLFNYGVRGDSVLCTFENGIDKSTPCPVCVDTKQKPPKEHCFKVIDFGEVIYDEEQKKEICVPDQAANGKEYQYQARKLMAKSGTTKYPGPMIAIAELRKRKGQGEIVGMVMDCSRAGEKSPRCGNSFVFVEMVPQDKIREYLKSLGAGRHETDREKYLDNLLANPVWKDEFDVPTVAQLRGLIRGGQTQGGGNAFGGGNATGGGNPGDYGPSGGSSDVPF